MCDIESDSTLVIHFLSSLKHDVSWHFSTIWFNCRAMIASMSVKVSHIYREGNQVAVVLRILVQYKWVFIGGILVLLVRLQLIAGI